MYRVDAVGLGAVSRRTNKAVNHGLTDIGTLQQVWELRFGGPTCQRCAARAALDLKGAEHLPACACARVLTKRPDLAHHPDTFP